MGYAWTVFKNLIALTVAILVLGKAETPYETVVLALLILIYTNVNAFFATWSLGSTELMLGLAADFQRLRGILNTPEDDAALKVATETVERAKVHYYINAAFAGLLYVGTLAKLILSL